MNNLGARLHGKHQGIQRGRKSPLARISPIEAAAPCWLGNPTGTAFPLSYLTKQGQTNPLESIESEDCTPSLFHAIQMKKISFRGQDIRKFFPKSYTHTRIQEVMACLSVRKELLPDLQIAGAITIEESFSPFWLIPSGNVLGIPLCGGEIATHLLHGGFFPALHESGETPAP